MKRLSVALSLFFWVFSVFAQGGVISSGGKVPTDQAILSQSDWYTGKQWKDISALGSVITVSTLYPGYLLKAFHNPRIDSSIKIVCITSIGDTIPVRIPADGGFTSKLPIIAKIITASSNDSVVPFFQKR